MVRFLFTCLVVLFSGEAFCQAPAEDQTFRLENLSHLIISELNRFRASKGLDTLERDSMLTGAAEMSAQDLADNESDKTDLKNSLQYLKVVGASKKGAELTMKAVISKGREDFRTDEVAKVIYTRWENNEKNLAVLLDPKYLLTGIVGTMDEEGEKVYVSAFFGGYDILNEGVMQKKQLAVPFNTASKSLKAPDPRGCKTCEQWRNYDLLHRGLAVREGKIYLSYPNTRELRRIFKKPNDGLAVDIVQRSQYSSAYYNIVDHNLYNKGVMSKVIYKEKFFKKNLLISKDKKANRKVKGIEVEMGKFDPKITGPFELNLIVVQNGKACKTVTRGYDEQVNTESNTPIGLLPYPNTRNLKPPFEPRTESSILNFVIPFEKNKSEFNDADIQPFLKALNEPDFIIDGLYIYAYSSIEGDSVANARLQEKRAGSVLNILQKMQNTKISPTILLRDSWGLFLLENEDGKYADIVNLGKKKAIERINGDAKLLEELEPILAKERFAQIIMDVTYDLSGDKEQRLARISFEKSLKSGNYKSAYKIMEFIRKRTAEQKFPISLLDSLAIPENEKTTGLINNLIYSRYALSNSIDEEDASTIERLINLEPSNPVLQYNKIFCQLKLDSNAGHPDHQTQVQQTINGLYGQLDSNYVNGLNIEWQFKIMESVDTLPNSEVLIDACIARIKSFYNIKEATWQNAVKLAQVFNKAHDYRNAAATLEPYLFTTGVNEDLVFFYISNAGRVREKYYSRIFAKALDIAKDKNKDRYCKLFGEPYMTFQVLENPPVKRTYQLSCGN